MKRNFVISIFIILASINVKGQDKLQVNGSLMLNTGLYQYDSSLNTTNSQYLHQLSSAEAWFTINANYDGFYTTVRYDLFENSQLINPNEDYTAQGLNFFSVTKSIGNFTFTGGNFYDQIGSGILFRAYEERTLGLDYAMQGIRIIYKLNDSTSVKVFGGNQKNRFAVTPQFIRCAEIDHLWGIGKVGFNTGAGFMNRTLDDATVQQLITDINNLPLSARFNPVYNVYAGTFYNTAIWKNFNWYVEGAAKSKEAVFITNPTTDSGELVNKNGYVIYSALGYSRSGLGINLQYRKIDNFILRVNPYDNLLVGVMDYLPALSKQDAYRLPARYSISALPQGESAYQGEITYSFDTKNNINFNTSQVFDPTGNLLFREYYADYTKKFNPAVKMVTGLNSVIYDQSVYESEPTDPTVHTITPFTEWTIRLGKSLRKSIQFEAQYLFTRQDVGDFAYLEAEYDLAPKFTFTLLDMYNDRPVLPNAPKLHYPGIFTSYTVNQTVISIGYTKQPEGIICTGGICRVEPAFSGLKATLNTNF